MINQSDPKMIMESREAIYIRPCLDELMSKEMAISQVQCPFMFCTEHTSFIQSRSSIDFWKMKKG